MSIYKNTFLTPKDLMTFRILELIAAFCKVPDFHNAPLLIIWLDKPCQL